MQDKPLINLTSEVIQIIKEEELLIQRPIKYIICAIGQDKTLEETDNNIYYSMHEAHLAAIQIIKKGTFNGYKITILPIII